MKKIEPCIWHTKNKKLFIWNWWKLTSDLHTTWFNINISTGEFSLTILNFEVNYAW